MKLGGTALLLLTLLASQGDRSKDPILNYDSNTDQNKIYRNPLSMQMAWLVEGVCETGWIEK